jgi:hypothetical protein
MFLIDRAEVVAGLLKIHANMCKMWHDRLGMTNVIGIIYNLIHLRGPSTDFLPARSKIVCYVIMFHIIACLWLRD